MANKIKLMVGDYMYQLPEVPNDERDILFYDQKKKDQYWKMPYNITSFRDMSASQKKGFIEKEHDRWTNGVWFFNNGEPTYLTGMYYDHLVNMTFTDFGKAKFMINQMHDFYFRDLVAKDDNCYGMLWLKPRRYGMTSEEMTNLVYVAMSDFNKHCGLVSIDKETTDASIFDPMVSSYFKRPKYLQPKVYKPNGKLPKTEMAFSSGVIKEGSDDDMFLDLSGELGSWIKPSPTVVNAFDSLKLHYLTVDEVWKWVACDPKEFWGIHKKCLIAGGDICGKASLLSTMGDGKNMKAAIKAGFELWVESDPSVRDLNGQTTSGLYRAFVDAIYTYHKYIDVYGKLDVEKAEEQLHNDMAKYEIGSQDYINEKKRMPRCPEDAMMSADTFVTFDNKRIIPRIEILKKMPISERPYVQGTLEENPKTGRISFEHDSNGLWMFDHLPYHDIHRRIDASNRFKKEDGKYYRPINCEGAGGYDGVNFADVDTTSKNLSRAASIFRQKFDYYGDGSLSGTYSACMAYRPDEPFEADYQVILACRFLGMPVMIDRSGITRIKESFAKYGMVDYLLKDPKDNIIGMLATNNKSFIRNGTNKMVTYWKKPRVKEDGTTDPDRLILTPFIPVLEDGKVFDPLKTTKSDVLIANFLAEFGLDQIKETSERDMQTTGLENNPFFANRR